VIDDNYNSIVREWYVISGALKSKSMLDQIRLLLPTSEYFRHKTGKTKNSSIYRAILNIDARGETVTWMSVHEECSKKDEPVLRADLWDLDMVITFPSISMEALIDMANKIRQQHLKQEIKTFGLKLADYSETDEATLPDIAGKLMRAAATAGEIPASQQLRMMKDVIDNDVIPVYEDWINGKVPEQPLKTGWPDIDNCLGGFHPGELTIVAAVIGEGKTTFCMNIAEYLAGRGVPIGVFSMEMKGQLLAERMGLGKIGIDHNIYRMKRRLSDDSAEKYATEGLTDVWPRLRELPIVIYEGGRLEVNQLKSLARQMVENHGCQLLIVDYLQLAKVERRDNIAIEVGEVSHSLVDIAKELAVPVISVSQMRRPPQQRPKAWRPSMHDLRYSDEIGADAQAIILLHREKDERGIPSDNLEVLIPKTRTGLPGKVEMRFIGSRSRFEVLDDDRE
jgi:replicative DNA helicase